MPGYVLWSESNQAYICINEQEVRRPPYTCELEKASIYETELRVHIAGGWDIQIMTLEEAEIHEIMRS